MIFYEFNIRRFERDPVLEKIKHLNINNRKAKKQIFKEHFRECFKQSYARNFILSLLTFGYYSIKLYKKTRLQIINALAARKLRYYYDLQTKIENMRSVYADKAPRFAMNAIFMRIQCEKITDAEDALEFKAIYYPSEILLFITNPISIERKVKAPRYDQKLNRCLRSWQELKKKPRANQYRQIETINRCNEILTKDYHLNHKQIHERFPRTQVYQKNRSLLSRMRYLSRTFQEIVIAYQDLDETRETHSDIYEMIQMLSKASKSEIRHLFNYLENRELPDKLSRDSRKRLIQLSSKQECLQEISAEELHSLSNLTLSSYQANFLLLMRDVPHITPNLLKWAFSESTLKVIAPKSFMEQIQVQSRMKAIHDPHIDPVILTLIKSDPVYNLMTSSFAREIHREWAPLHLITQGTMLFELPHIDALSDETLLHVYHELRKFAGEDDELLEIIQEALSQTRKNAFQSAVEEGIEQLFGGLSDYLLPILSIYDVRLDRKEMDQVDIIYSFQQLILRQGEKRTISEEGRQTLITQPLIKEAGVWISLDHHIDNLTL